jgi:uncharacterized membrane protein
MKIPKIVWQFLCWLLFFGVIIWPIMYVVTWFAGSFLPQDFDGLLKIFRSPVVTIIFAVLFASIITFSSKQEEQEKQKLQQ